MLVCRSVIARGYGKKITAIDILIGLKPKQTLSKSKKLSSEEELEIINNLKSAVVSKLQGLAGQIKTEFLFAPKSLQ